MRHVNKQFNNLVVKEFKGVMGFRYHPTKGYRREKGFDPSEPLRSTSTLERMIVHDVSDRSAENLIQKVISGTSQ